MLLTVMGFPPPIAGSPHNGTLEAPLPPCGASSFASSANVRLALALLLAGLSARLLALAPGRVALVLRLALVFRGTRLVHRNGNSLLAAFHLAAFAAGPLLSSPCLNSCMTLPEVFRWLGVDLAMV